MNFYNISAGSLEELKYQLLLSKDLKFISEKGFKDIYSLAEEVGKLLHGWIKSNKAKL